MERHDNEKINELCNEIRKLSFEKEYDKCLEEISKAMAVFPSNPTPHNLYGIILEITGDHLNAMKHFRAAWSLDPTYSPVNQNLETYGTFSAYNKPAFDESDVIKIKKEEVDIVYDEHNIGHVIRKIISK